MKLYRRVLAFLLILSAVFFVLPGQAVLFELKADAAGSLVVYVAAGSDGRPLLDSSSVTLAWNAVDGAVSYSVFYRSETGSLISNTVNSVSNIINYKITGLKKDFIYQFKVKAVLDTGETLTFTKRIITGISLSVDRVEEQAIYLPGGGKEIGGRPELKFRWKIPRKWNNDDIEEAGSVTYFEQPDKLDYDIYLGTDNSGMNRTQLKIRYSKAGGINQYIVTRFRSGVVKTVADKVYYNDPLVENGYIVFTSKGGDDSVPETYNTDYPAQGQDPQFSSRNIVDFGATPDYRGTNLQNIYKNPDLTPGTVLRMSIEPYFHDDTGNSSYAYLRSSVENGFTYTSLRYQITKDSSNNLLVTVFKVNQSGRNASEGFANFSYEVQYDTKPEFNNFITSARQRDDYLEGDSMVIYIENKDYDTTFFYRVIAWSSNQSEKLYSLTLDYTLALDVSQAPLPEQLSARAITPVTGQVTNTFYGRPPDNGFYTVKTSEIKLRWKKPVNYDEIMSDSINPVYYHFLISSSQSDAAGKSEVIGEIFANNAFSMEYDIKYREILSVNINACNVVNENGTADSSGSYLEYSVNGLQLFQKAAKVNNFIVTEALPNPDKYPTYLLPNRTYFIKIFATKGSSLPYLSESDKSLPIGFTTLLDLQKEPPVPMNFSILKNEISYSNKNSITLQWDKISFNIKDYTNNIAQSASVYYDIYMSDSAAKDTFLFAGTTELLGDIIFSGQNDPAARIVNAEISSFPSDVALRARFGSFLKPNTTYYFMIKTRIVIGAEPARLSSLSRMLAVTTQKGAILPPNPQEKLPQVPVDFSIAIDEKGNKKFGSSDVSVRWTSVEKNVRYTLIRTSRLIDSGINITAISVNPESKLKVYLAKAADNTIIDGYAYNGGIDEYSYHASDLYPNTIYYFSLRAEKDVSITRADGSTENITLFSAWITIPVTTLLIEAPEVPEISPGYGIGVSWTVSGRTSTPDDKHEIDVRWKGRDNYHFELAIKSEDETGYKILTEGTSFKYMSIEKTTQLVQSGYSMYYARISSLKSNMRYWIKVRSCSYNYITAQNDYSKYAGPAATRTEFSQNDYDANEQVNTEAAIYADKIKLAASKPYWVVNDSDASFKIILRNDMSDVFMKSISGRTITFDLSSLAGKTVTTGGVYIPAAFLRRIYSSGKDIAFVMNGSEYIIKPDAINMDKSMQISQLKKDSSISDIYIYYELSKSSGGKAANPGKTKPVSDIQGLGITAVGMRFTAAEIDTQFKNMMSNVADIGLSILKSMPLANKNTSLKLSAAINDTIGVVNKIMLGYASQYMEGPDSAIRMSKGIIALDVPLQIKIKVTGSAKVQYAGYTLLAQVWKKLSNARVSAAGKVYFESPSAGIFTVFSLSPGESAAIPAGHWASLDVSALSTKYNISDIIGKFPGASIDNAASMEDAVILAGKILAPAKQQKNSLPLKIRAASLNLPEIVDFSKQERLLTREELAALVIGVYGLKTGSVAESLKPTKNIKINDIAEVSDDYLNYISLSAELGLIDMDKGKNFKPQAGCTKALLISAFARLLRLLGQL